MNDAVAIILFKVVGDIFVEGSVGGAVGGVVGDDEKSSGAIILGIIGGFILNVVCSLLIGAACGKFGLIQPCSAPRSSRK